VFVEAMTTWLRAWRGAFSHSGRGAAPLGAQRLAVLLIGFPLFLLLQLLHWLCLSLDDLLFPAYRRQGVACPVFVLGVPRSGTTFLHRELARDPAFTTTSTWEVFFAPSLLQRYLLRGLGRIDAVFGAPGGRSLRWLLRRLSGPLDAVHAVSLEAAEEDYLALLPAAGCFFALMAFPACADFRHLGKLDAMEDGRRRRLLAHYHRLLQRHVHAHGGRQLLSKNAAFASWLPYLRERYPDCVPIVCIRDPLTALSSQLSSLLSARRLFALAPDAVPMTALFSDYYAHWFAVLADSQRADPAASLVVEQEWLAGHTDEVLAAIYQRLGREAPQPSVAARSEASRHRHAPQDFGLDEASLPPSLWRDFRTLQAASGGAR
jgi:hypothetical protein